LSVYEAAVTSLGPVQETFENEPVEQSLH
jgi:hypothetical protein